MYLNKLILKEFGKFQNKEIELESGLNVICAGDDEQGYGKTTIKEFISAMLFGIEKSKGINEGKSDYELKKPKRGREFGGKANIVIGGKTYLIERSFLFNAKKSSVYDFETGALEASDKKTGAEADVIKKMIDTDKKSYDEIMCVSVPEDCKAETEKYLANVLRTGSGTVDKDKALKALAAEKKNNDPRPLVRRLDELNKKIEQFDDLEDKIAANENELVQLNEEFAMEAAKRKRVARKLIEHEDGSITYEPDKEIDEKINKLTEAGFGDVNSINYYTEHPEEKKKVKFTDRLPVIFATGVLVVMVIAMIVHLMPFEPAIQKMFVIFTIIFVVFTILDGLNAKGFFSSDEITTPTDEDFMKILDELQNEQEEKEAIEFDMTFAKEYQQKRAELVAEQSKLVGMRAERNRLKNEFNDVFKKKGELEEELRAIKYAMLAIDKIANEMQVKNAAKFAAVIPYFVSAMTEDKYEDVTLDDKLKVHIKPAGSNNYVSIYDISDQEAKLIYLAVRMAAVKMFAKEKLPVVFDDVLKTIDDEHIATAIIGVFASIIKLPTEQIVFLTDERMGKGIADIANQVDIEANLIEIIQ